MCEIWILSKDTCEFLHVFFEKRPDFNNQHTVRKMLYYFSQSALTLWQSQETSISNKDLYRAETSDVRYCDRSTHKTNVFRWQQVFLSNKVKNKVYIILFQKCELRNSNFLKNFSFWRLYSRQNINKKWFFLTTEMT